jgi:hypothetical protein
MVVVEAMVVDGEEMAGLVGPVSAKPLGSAGSEAQLPRMRAASATTAIVNARLDHHSGIDA